MRSSTGLAWIKICSRKTQPLQKAETPRPFQGVCQLRIITLHRFRSQAMPYFMIVSIPSNLNLASYPMVSICVKASRHPFSSSASLADFSAASFTVFWLTAFIDSGSVSFVKLSPLFSSEIPRHEEHTPQVVRAAVQIPVGQLLIDLFGNAFTVYQKLQFPACAWFCCAYKIVDNIVSAGIDPESPG